MTGRPSPAGTSLPLAVDGADPACAPLPSEFDAEAAAILAAATAAGSVGAGAAALAAARADPRTELFGRVVDGGLVAVYALRSVEMAREITYLAVAEEHRRLGHGRACLQDALRRCGKRPLVVETDDEALAFYRAVGFKLVGKRGHPSGTLRYRLGWHAPRPAPTAPQPLSIVPVSARSGEETRAGGGADASAPTAPAAAVAEFS